MIQDILPDALFSIESKQNKQTRKGDIDISDSRNNIDIFYRHIQVFFYTEISI